MSLNWLVAVLRASVCCSSSSLLLVAGCRRAHSSDADRPPRGVVVLLVRRVAREEDEKTGHEHPTARHLHRHGKAPAVRIHDEIKII